MRGQHAPLVAQFWQHYDVVEHTMEAGTMISMDIEELYRRHVRPLPLSDRLRLAELIVHEAADQPQQGSRRSIMGLRGLGAEIWSGIDADQYVDGLRNEWEGRP
jgi:hypothetical protein